jgi:hypothetical protein
MQGRRLRVASVTTAPGPDLEGVPRFRPKVVLMSLSSYILTQAVKHGLKVIINANKKKKLYSPVNWKS